MLTSARPEPITSPSDRYSSVAIVLHWTIAAAVALQLYLGWHMEDLEGLPRSTLLQLHKSVGITVLLLTAVRIFWRRRNPPPPPHSSLTPLEHKLSHWVHMGFYAALLALPLTGWAMVSMEQGGWTSLFGAIPWPGFPFLNFLPGGAQDALADLLDEAHGLFVWPMLALIFLHVAGALKHQWISRDPTIARMAPGVKPGALLDARLIGIALIAAGLAGAVYWTKLPEAPLRPKPASLAVADIYLDVIQPALNRRCASCHSDDQSRGGLSISSYAALMRGGRQGSVVVPGNGAKSDLYRRILPSAGKDYMPKGDRPPLSPEQVQAIKLWIDIGAPRAGVVGKMGFKPAQLALLQKAMGSAGGESGPARALEVLPVVPKADAQVMATLEGSGFIVRPVDKQSNLLDVNFTAKRNVTAEDIANLAKIGQQIRTLTIRNGGVDDGQVKTLAGFPNLVRLRLEGSAVTDASGPVLGAMKAVRELSLIRTKITDAGLASLAAAPSLQAVYVWQTGVTKAGADKVKAAHPALKVDLGLSAADVDPHEPVIPVVN